jgi:hypothetical protein
MKKQISMTLPGFALTVRKLIEEAKAGDGGAAKKSHRHRQHEVTVGFG